MINRSKKVLWVLCFFLGTGLAIAAPMAPSLQVSAPDHDFGEVEEGGVVSHDYLIKNTGQGPLEIYNVRPGWGCSVAHFDRAIPPGGEGKITLDVNLKGYHGQVWKSATVISNDLQKPNVPLSIHGKVRPYIELLPAGSITFNGKGPGQDEKTIDILATSQPFHIQRIENRLAEKIRYHLETVDNGRHYRLKVTKRQKAGKFFGFIRCFTDHPRKPEIQIPIISNLDG